LRSGLVNQFQLSALFIGTLTEHGERTVPHSPLAALLPSSGSPEQIERRCPWSS
jgi:hypothetical protein